MNLVKNIPRHVIIGNKINLQVLNRSLAAKTAHETPYCVLSIIDSDKEAADIKHSPHLKGICRLQFEDIEAAVDGEWWLPFAEWQADKVLAFVNEQLELGVELIIVHCEAGLSRSAGMAGALSKLLNGDDKFFYDNFRPNRLVARTILETAHKLNWRECAEE